MAQDNKVCKFCRQKGHSKFYCKARIRTPIPKTGKHYKKWTDVKKKYFDNHPPDRYGMYECYLCLKKFPREEITIDHVIPRSGAPQLRYVENNLRYACWPCNSAKGSKRY